MLPRSAYAHTHTSILYVTPCVCPGVCPLGSKVSLIDLSSQKQLLDQFLSAEARLNIPPLTVSGHLIFVVGS